MTTFSFPTTVKIGTDADSKDEAGQGLVQYAAALYDFAAHGGAISTIGLGVYVPPNAIVDDDTLTILRLITSPTSAGSTATIAVNLETAGDLKAAQIISNAYWTTAPATKSLIPAAPFVTTVRRELTVTIATEALTAGKFWIVVSYILIPI